MGQQPEDRRREVVDDMDEFHAALMRWVLPEALVAVALPGGDEDGAPGWWRGDDEAEASTMAGVRNRATATAPRRSPGRRGAPR